MNFNHCFRSCSPDYSQFLDDNNKVRICKGFADKWYEKCAKDEVQVGSSCKVIGEQYSDAASFMESFLDMVYDNKSPQVGVQCWNSSSLIFLTPFVVFVFFFLI